jgi:hypothetical protein
MKYGYQHTIAVIAPGDIPRYSVDQRPNLEEGKKVSPHQESNNNLAVHYQSLY